jgi:uncharacterized protein (TIGR03437 family)
MNTSICRSPAAAPACLIAFALLLAMGPCWRAAGSGPSAQNYLISTLAGGAMPVTPIAGTSTSVLLGFGVAVDPSGNLYFPSPTLGALFKLDTSGILTRVAGTGLAGFSGDNGPALSAQLAEPIGVAVDASGNLYIADALNSRIRRVSASGTITTVAGNGNSGYSGDGGLAASAQLARPVGVAVDAGGNLYIADTGNQRIRKVSAGGIITTVAGNGNPGFSGDGGPATSEQLWNPSNVAVDAVGNLYIADQGNNRIRKVNASGTISTVAGNGNYGYSGDGGAATGAQLAGPAGVAVDAAGNLYIADTFNSLIRQVNASGTISTVAGGGYANPGEGGAATGAQLDVPTAVAVDSAGGLYFADMGSSRVRKVSAAKLTTVAGGATGDGGLGVFGSLASPIGLAGDSAGNLYIADNGNQRVRRIAANGVITTVAGTGAGGYSGDGGAGPSGQVATPCGVAIDAAGDLFIADTNNSRIRKVNAAGTITTVAGNGNYGYSGDGGPATSAMLNAPRNVSLDSAGKLYIADTFNSRIRMVDTNGTITTVAGSASSGYAGDGGAAASAQLLHPYGVAVDSAGNLYIADSGNARVRVVSTSGIITTVAGGGAAFPGDGGPASSALLESPRSVFLSSSGAIYVTDTDEFTLRLLTPMGAAPVLTIQSSHSGSFAQGQAGGAYSLTVTNAASAGATSGVVTVTETLPSSLTLASMAGSGWSCTANTCTRGDALAAGSYYPAITVTVNVSASAPSQVTTQATVSGGGAAAGQATDLTNIEAMAISGPSSLPAGQVGVAYTATTLTAAGGSGSYTWSAAGLPAGLGIGSATGIVSGMPTTNSGSPYTVQVTVTDSNSAQATRTYSLTINAAPANLMLINGVSNAASGQAAIAPNTWVSIYGANFAAAGFSDDWSKSILNGNLPTTLDGVSVSVGGSPAYVSFVSPGQVNVLTPNVASGSASVTVTVGATTTAPATVTAQQFSPAFFPWPNGQPVATHLDYSWAVKNGTFAGVTTVPAKPGEYIILWGTGFGPTSPAAPAGVTIPATTTYNAANPVSVTIGGVNASVYGTALASGFAGLYQVVALIPAPMSNGDYAVVAKVGGVATTATTLTVQN